MKVDKNTKGGLAIGSEPDSLGVQLAYLDLLIRALIEHEKRLAELVRKVITRGKLTNTRGEEAVIC